MKKIYVLIFVVFILSLFVGYALGRGYKTYEINSGKSPKQTASVNSPVTSLSQNPDILNDQKELVDPTVYAPKVTSTTLEKDAQSGYNLKISAQHFEFDSKTLGKSLEQNSGYAYIFVNDQAVGRSYSEYYHLPESLFRTGTNTVSIVLHANNYKTWWSKKGTLKAVYTTEVVNK